MSSESHNANRNVVRQDRWSIKKIHLNALSPESAAAVITFVRAIYGFALPETKELVWASWFDIAKYAPTYLSRHAPEVAEEAAQKFMASCMGEPDPDVVVKILQKLDHHNCPPNARFVETIRRYHEPQLLRNEKYRADPRLCDREALLRHIDNMLDKPEQGSVAV